MCYMYSFYGFFSLSCDVFEHRYKIIITEHTYRQFSPIIIFIFVFFLFCFSQTIMKDKWMNLGYEEDELKPYLEPEPDFKDLKRIGMTSGLLINLLSSGLICVIVADNRFWPALTSQYHDVLCHNLFESRELPYKNHFCWTHHWIDFCKCIKQPFSRTF